MRFIIQRVSYFKFGLVLLLLGFAFAACEGKKSSSKKETKEDAPKPEEPKPVDSDPTDFAITSSAFKAGGVLPFKYSCKNTCPTRGSSGTGDERSENTTPPLKFWNIPAGTNYLALILFDKDSPNYMHWYVAMPATLKELPEDIDVSDNTPVVSGIEIHHDAQNNGAPHYNGPYPPSGTTHNYEFRLYAIASTATATKINGTMFPSGAIGLGANGNFKQFLESQIANTDARDGTFKGSIIDTAVLSFTFTGP